MVEGREGGHVAPESELNSIGAARERFLKPCIQNRGPCPLSMSHEV